MAIAFTSCGSVKNVDLVAKAFSFSFVVYFPFVDAMAVAITSSSFIIYVDIVAKASTSSGSVINVDTVAIAFIFRVVKWVEAVAIAWSVIV